MNLDLKTKENFWCFLLFFVCCFFIYAAYMNSKTVYSEHPDQSSKMHNLVMTFAIHILQCTMILYAGSEYLDRTKQQIRYITKTYLYNVDPLKPHFYIVKLGFTGVYIIFLISAQKHRLWVLVRTRGGSNEYPQSMFWSEIWKKYQNFIWKFSVLGGKIFSIFE